VTDAPHRAPLGGTSGGTSGGDPNITPARVRRYRRLRRHPMSKDELLVWCLRFHERRTFAEVAALMGEPEPRVRELDESMTCRALAAEREAIAQRRIERLRRRKPGGRRRLTKRRAAS